MLGGIVADAATMPLHWIYKPEAMAELLKSKGKEATPEFFDPPSCPFYQARQAGEGRREPADGAGPRAARCLGAGGRAAAQTRRPRPLGTPWAETPHAPGPAPRCPWAH